MRRLVALVATVATLCALAIAGEALSASSVTVADNVFKPRSLSVKKGTTVTWKWVGRASHNVVSTGGPTRLRSKTQKSGSYSAKLSKAGTVRYVCTIHSGQSGTITVR